MYHHLLKSHVVPEDLFARMYEDCNHLLIWFWLITLLREVFYSRFVGSDDIIWYIYKVIGLDVLLIKWWCLICESSDIAWYADQVVVLDMTKLWCLVLEVKKVFIKMCWSRWSLKIIWCSDHVDIIEYQDL